MGQWSASRVEKGGGYEHLTREILRHYESNSFLNPVTLQCDKETGTSDVRREVARERKARIVPRRYQSNGSVEAVHGHIQRLTRCYQTQIKRTLVCSFQQNHPAIQFAVRCTGFVFTRFTVRPDGRTSFQYLPGAGYVSGLCVFGESVFGIIREHDVRAASSRTDSADQSAGNHLESCGAVARPKRLGAQCGTSTRRLGCWNQWN